MGPPLILRNRNKILEENSGLLFVDHSIPTRTPGAAHPLVLSFPRPGSLSLDKINFVAYGMVRMETLAGVRTEPYLRRPPGTPSRVPPEPELVSEIHPTIWRVMEVTRGPLRRILESRHLPLERRQSQEKKIVLDRPYPVTRACQY